MFYFLVDPELIFYYAESEREVNMLVLHVINSGSIHNMTFDMMSTSRSDFWAQI